MRVAYGLVDEALADAEELGGGRERAAIDGGGEQGARRVAPLATRVAADGVHVDAEEALRAVEVRQALEPSRRRAAAHGSRRRAPSSSELRDVGVAHPRVRRAADGDDGRAAGDTLEPRVGEGAILEARQERRRDGRGFDDRLGKRGAAGLLERQHQRHLVETEPARTLGHQHAQDAELGERRPARRDRAPCSLLPDGAHRGRRTDALEHAADAVAEAELLLVEREMHAVGQSRGRPSTRSAMTLRWISLVPA